MSKTEEEFECMVVFTDGSNQHWWSRFMKEGYRHCFILYPLKTHGGLFGEDWCVQIDPATNFMRMMVYTDPIEDVLEAMQPFSEAITCRVANLDKTKYNIEVRTCVTNVKLMLGVRWWHVQTPWKLRNRIYKHLEVIGFRRTKGYLWPKL